MVLPNRTLENGLNGYSSATTIPKARRSIRRRGSCQKTIEGGQICAFDLLATVAEKLLEESNDCSSASSSVALRFDRCGIRKGTIKKEIQDSSEGSIFFSSLQRDVSRGKLETVSEKIEEHDPPLSSSAYSVKVDSDATDLEKGINGKLDNSGGTKTEENFHLPLSSDSNPNNASFLKKHENCVRNECKDDDEILSCYSQPNKTMKAYRSSTHFEEAKINQLLTSKCWKAAPKLTDYEASKRGGADKHMYDNKRSHCELDTLQRNTPIKKRKLFDRNSAVTCDGGISSESVSNSPVKSVDDEKKAQDVKVHEDNRTSSLECEHQESVRLSIKSFKIPELFIDVPETTTIGSLKRTVLEAVTSILSGGLRVGVLVQGKKLQDDNKTLLQTSLCQNNDKTEAIQFMLEPNRPTQTSNPTYSEDAPILLACDSHKFVNRPRVHVNKDMNLLGTLDKPCMTDSNSPTTQSSMEALAIVPVSHSSTRNDIGQRRTRRPFSVTEVEALVHAVEKLGTGRWRDVKLCSFENAKHRTYVDLKDKWKTLVHTARISPQQRRGEPVPQELLDRVLATQTYWSDHQAKQHGKHQQLIVPKHRDSTALRV